MTNHPFRPDPAPGTRSQRGVALPWIFFGFLAVAGFLLLSEHRAHVMGALPFLLLALCPLMHFFHGGHGSSGGHEGHGAPGPGPRDAGDGTGSQGGSGTTAAPRPPHQH